MTLDLDQQIKRGHFPESPNWKEPESVGAVVVRDVTSLDDGAFVIIPSFDRGQHAHGPCKWMPRVDEFGSVFGPARGDIGIVIEDEQTNQWLIGWTGGVEILPTSPLAVALSGSINSDGTTHRGTGFTSSRSATGLYTVTFTTAFGGEPSVQLTAINNASAASPQVGSQSAASFSVRMYDAGGVLVDSAFNFKAE